MFVVKVVNISKWSDHSEHLVLQVVFLQSVVVNYQVMMIVGVWCLEFGGVCVPNVVRVVGDQCPSVFISV